MKDQKTTIHHFSFIYKENMQVSVSPVTVIFHGGLYVQTTIIQCHTI